MLNVGKGGGVKEVFCNYTQCGMRKKIIENNLELISVKSTEI